MAILGLGVVLIWPRFLVLLSYTAMLFLYYLLARWEEERCIAEYGESYGEYLRSTGRILPRIPGRPPVGPGPLRPLRVAGIAAITLVAALALGLVLRSYSLARVSSFYTDSTAVLSPALLEPAELEGAYEIALTDPELTARLQRTEPEVGFWSTWCPRTGSCRIFRFTPKRRSAGSAVATERGPSTARSTRCSSPGRGFTPMPSGGASSPVRTAESRF